MILGSGIRSGQSSVTSSAEIKHKKSQLNHRALHHFRLYTLLCFSEEMAEGHIEFYLSVCVYLYVCSFVRSRIVSDS